MLAIQPKYSHPHQGRSPGKAAAKRLEKNEIAVPDPTVSLGFRQCQRHRGRRGIGVAIDGNDHPFGWQPELAAHRIDDPPIGLMRYKPIDLAPLQPIGDQSLVHHFSQSNDGMAEHFAPVHHQMPGLVVLSDRTVDIQDVAQSALRM